MEWTISKLAKALEPYVRRWVREMLGDFDTAGGAGDCTWLQGTCVPEQDKTGNRGDNAIDLQVDNGSDSEVASGDHSGILSGEANTAAGDVCVVAGGDQNAITASCDHSGIFSGGGSYVGDADYAAILGGFEQSIDGADRGAILAGDNNVVEHDYVVSMGYRPLSYSPHCFLIGNAETPDGGDAQGAIYIMREEILHSTADWFNLYLTGTEAINIPSDGVFVFEVLLAGTTQGATKSFGFTIAGVIENDGGTTSILGTPTVTTLYDADDVSFDAQAVADDATDELKIQVQDTDGGGDRVKWVARVSTAEVVH